MKKTISIVLTLILVFSLFSGCAKTDESQKNPELPETPQSETADTPADSSEQTEIKTVDEFIKAIAPGAEITLAPGFFLLSDSATYEKDTGNPYCEWYYNFDGYELLIKDVDNLTIHGSGMNETTIQAEPRYANVLHFSDCTNIHITHLTAGHTIADGGCIADVLRFDGCNKVTVSECGLFGCGSTGVSTDFCNNMTISNCEIYNCSSTGVWFSDSRNITVEDCYIHDLGNKGTFTALAAIGTYGSQNITFRHCNTQGNTLFYYINSTNSFNINIIDCGAADNDFDEAVFNLFCSSVTMTNTEITGNAIWNWYSEYSDSNVMDENGSPLSSDDLEKMYIYEEEPITEVAPVDIEMKEVTVHTVDEFLSAISPNTRIFLDAPVFDLTTASGYGGVGGMYYEWREEYDGPSLWIYGVENLEITSPDFNKNNHKITAFPRYADVLGFEDCRNIMVSGFTAGHTQEPGTCIGGVLNFMDCEEVFVSNMNLYGCGTLGVITDHCRCVNVYDTNIYECSFGGIQMSKTKDIIFNNCSFWSLGGPTFNFSSCKNILIDGTERSNGTYNY